MTEAPRDIRVAAPVGVEPEGVEREPDVMRREGSHASPLEARGQGNVDPGVPRRDLQVAVEHARLLRQEAVGQRLPPLDRVRRPDSPNQFLRVWGELLGGDQRACLEVCRNVLRDRFARLVRRQGLHDRSRGCACG